jgi:outer membrane protein assembly factor BamD (BamD/ComL family)
MNRQAASILVLAIAATSQAQPAEFKLDASGKWSAVAGPAPSVDQATINNAKTLLAEDKPGQAKAVLNTWIDDHQTSESPLLAQAYLLRGDAKTADGNEYKALYDYEVVAKDYAATQEFAKAVERELDIAVRYVNGLKRRFLGMRVFNAEDVGEELLVRTAERMPGSRLGERALIELADYYYRDRDLKMAALACEKFVENYPKSSYTSHAKQQRIYASIGMFKGPNYDAVGLNDAKVLIEEYAKEDPVGAQRADLSESMLAKIDESTAAQQLEKTRYYIRRGDPVSARATLRRLVTEHPRSVAAASGEQLMASKGWELPKKPEPMPPPPKEGEK